MAKTSTTTTPKLRKSAIAQLTKDMHAAVRKGDEFSLTDGKGTHRVTVEKYSPDHPYGTFVAKNALTGGSRLINIFDKNVVPA